MTEADDELLQATRELLTAVGRFLRTLEAAQGETLVEPRGTPRLAYTVPEAAQLLRVSTRLVYEMVRRGELKAVRLHRRRLVIPARALEQVLAGAVTPK